ncbi:hypothetical protein BB561_000755 [Smittium simulii]|uniref:Uncharacterized protein n=1 Tax=Smittium simulii TaxID=133385 RepID=A0A2T9YXP5_9FUNG|nr:hypothetical protein BB561_000755 [Smittium simulii]
MAKGKSKANINPADKQRKIARKRELKKQKEIRKQVREASLLYKDTFKLEKELTKYKKLENEGLLDKNLKAKYKEVKEKLDLISKTRKEKGVQVKKRNEDLEDAGYDPINPDGMSYNMPGSSDSTNSDDSGNSELSEIEGDDSDEISNKYKGNAESGEISQSNFPPIPKDTPPFIDQELFLDEFWPPPPPGKPPQMFYNNPDANTVPPPQMFYNNPDANIVPPPQMFYNNPNVNTVPPPLPIFPPNLEQQQFTPFLSSEMAHESNTFGQAFIPPPQHMIINPPPPSNMMLPPPPPFNHLPPQQTSPLYFNGHPQYYSQPVYNTPFNANYSNVDINNNAESSLLLSQNYNKDIDLSTTSSANIEPSSENANKGQILSAEPQLRDLQKELTMLVPQKLLKKKMDLSKKAVNAAVPSVPQPKINAAPHIEADESVSISEKNPILASKVTNLFSMPNNYTNQAGTNANNGDLINDGPMPGDSTADSAKMNAQKHKTSEAEKSELPKDTYISLTVIESVNSGQVSSQSSNNAPSAQIINSKSKQNLTEFEDHEDLEQKINVDTTADTASPPGIKTRLDSLSLRDKKTINQLIDFIIVFSLAPKLLDGTTIPIEKRLESTKIQALGFQSQIFKKYNEITNRIYSSDIKSQKQANFLTLVEWTEKFGALITSKEYIISDVASITRSRALVDIISAFFQTAYSSQISQLQDLVSSIRVINLKKLFTKIFNCKSNRQLILESLFALKNFSRGKQRWFNTLVSRFLSRFLLFDDGIKTLFGFLISSDSTDKNLTTPKLDSIYNLIDSLPSTISEESYYSNILAQLSQIITNNSVLIEKQMDFDTDLNSDKDSKSSGINSDFIINIYKISIYVLDNVFARKNFLFKKYALPMLLDPILKWNATKKFDFDFSNSLEYLEPSDETSPLSTLIDTALNIKSESKLQKVSKPLIQIIDDSTSSKPQDPSNDTVSNNKNSLDIKSRDFLADDVMVNLSHTVQVFLGDKNDLFHDLQKDVIVKNEDLSKALDTIYVLSNHNLSSNSGFVFYILNTISESLFFWYQFLQECSDSLKDYNTSENMSSSKQLQDSQIFVPKFTLLENTMGKLEKILNKYFALCSTSEISSILNKLFLSDRLFNVIQDQTLSSGVLYPLFTLENNYKTCITYPKKYPYTLFLTILDETNQESLDFDAEVEVDDSNLNKFSNTSDLYQSKFKVSSLYALTQKLHNTPNINDLVASIFISLLNEYTALTEQINRLTLSKTHKKQSKIEILANSSNENKILTQESSPKLFILSQKFLLVSQTLQEFVVFFGPQALTKISHILAFVDTIIDRTLESPPISINNNDIIKLQNEIHLNLEKDEPINSEESQKNSQLDSQLDSSEQLILALNLFVAASASIFETNMGLDSGITNLDENQSTESLYSSIFKKLGKLKKQWNEYTLITQLVDQAIELSLTLQPHLNKLNHQDTDSKDANSEKILVDAEEEYYSALIDLQNPLVPIQAFGLTKLQDLIICEENYTSGALTTIQYSRIIETIVDLVQHDDSFIYLKAIQALTKASKLPNILPELLKILIEKYSNKNSSIDFRLRISEIFAGIIRNYGQAMVKYTDTVIPMFCKTLDYRENEDPDLVHSALSILGLYCEISPLVIKNYLLDIASFCKNACLSREYNQTVKRASLVLLVSIISGYSNNMDIAKSINVDVLKDIYNILKVIVNSNSYGLDTRDELLEHNANFGLQELSHLMKSFF